MAPSSSSAYAPIFGSSGLPSAVYSRRLSFFPWSTFMGLFDLKQGSTVISLFALFNKIAGVYGILAVFSGGTFAQVSLYAYSILSIGALLWGLRGISDEDPRVVLRYSHFFAFDHLLSSFWTFFFAYSTFSAPHKGERPPLALHQQGLMDLIENLELQYEIPGKVQHHSPITGEARVHGAQEVWNFEKGFAATVLIAGWLLKIFFALTLYSYALHLRHNTYASLPFAKSSQASLHNILLQPDRTVADDDMNDQSLRFSTRRRPAAGSERQSAEYAHQQRVSYDGYNPADASFLSSGAIGGASISRPPSVRLTEMTTTPATSSPSTAAMSPSALDSHTGDNIGATGMSATLGRPTQAQGLERRVSAGPTVPISPSQSYFRRDL